MSAGTRTFIKDVLFRAGVGCGATQVRDLVLVRSGRARAVILTYHRVGGCDVMSRPAAAFQEDMEWLAERFDCLTLAGLCSRLDGGERRRRPLAAVTFDDGYRDNALVAVPILLKVGVPATFFVATSFIATEREFPHDRCARTESGEPTTFEKLTWDDLRAMQEAGFEIGSHTVNHCDLGAADRQVAHLELCESLSTLIRELGERPRALAFPWGRMANIPRGSSSVAARAGYYAAVTTIPGDASAARDRMLLPRIDVGNAAISRWGFRARVMQVPWVGRTGERHG